MICLEYRCGRTDRAQGHEAEKDVNETDQAAKPTVVVVGGGYGGITVAKALDETSDVVLVEPRDAFMHNIAALRALVDPTWLPRIFLPYAGCRHLVPVLPASYPTATTSETSWRPPAARTGSSKSAPPSRWPARRLSSRSGTSQHQLAGPGTIRPSPDRTRSSGERPFLR
jgi:choline dehydrogenase-like flavoprotein